MNFLIAQNQLVNFRKILLLIFLNIILIANSSCRSSLNQKNYDECIHKIEEERQKIRIGDGFSYKARSYEECRAPARYRMDTD